MKFSINFHNDIFQKVLKSSTVNFFNDSTKNFFGNFIDTIKVDTLSTSPIFATSIFLEILPKILSKIYNITPVGSEEV